MGLAGKIYRVVKTIRGCLHPGARVSYAQNGEDILVHEMLRGTLGVSAPTYLDIGANHPSRLSNTFFFYRLGGSGVLVEPDPVLHRHLASARPRDKCVNVGIGGATGGQQDFYILSAPALNSFSQSDAEQATARGDVRIVKVVKLEIVPINAFLEKHFTRDLAFASIDAEGMDEQIIDAWDFDRFRPQVMCVEAVAYTADGTGERRGAIAERLLQSDYVQWATTNLNEIFVDRRRLPSRHPLATSGVRTAPW